MVRIAEKSARPCAKRKPAVVPTLLSAAVLAAVFVPLTPNRAESASISCVSSGGGGGEIGSLSDGCVGSYTAGSAEESNIFKFFRDDSFTDLIYTLEIAGIPTSDFSLDVSDFLTTTADLVAEGALSLFPHHVCVPTFDADNCGLFRVFEVDGTASWVDGYLLTITWFRNGNPLSHPKDDGRNTILHAKGSSSVFDSELTDIDYDPAPSPTDPGISGRGDSFSTFGVFRSVPEPASILLFGTALAGALLRARNRKPTR